MQTERPIDVQQTRILGLEIERKVKESGRFEYRTTPFPHYVMIADKQKCFGIEISTIHTPPRKGSHFYSMMFILPESLKEKHPNLLGEDTFQQHYLLHNAITAVMSKYSIMKGVHVRQNQPAPEGEANRVAMEIRLSALKFKQNYSKMMAEIDEKIVKYQSNY